jgi:hypothetical protein
LNKTRPLYLNRLEIIPLLENLVYSGYLLQRYDDYEEFIRNMLSIYQNGIPGIRDYDRVILSVILNKIEQHRKRVFTCDIIMRIGWYLKSRVKKGGWINVALKVTIF